jgi:aminopeptidase 2
MDWWNELWLNEGFATFVGWLVTDHLFPEWKVWTSFVTDDYAQGLGLDSMRSSHAIDIDVNNPNEISQIFDAISYSKGACLIRMLNSYLSPEKFSHGVSEYLKKHAYSNAKTGDLWQALGKSSGKDVDKMMQNWTKMVGFPMITVDSESYNVEKKEMTLNISQKRFISSGGLEAFEDLIVWDIPIQICTHLNPKSPHSSLLCSKAGSVTFPYSLSDAFYKLNYESTGFYRVCYSQNHLELLSSFLKKNLLVFTVEDRIGILSDAFAFARSGNGSTIGALSLLNGFVNEEDYMVLSELRSVLNLISSAWYNHPEIVSKIDKLIISIFSSKVKVLGYEYPPSENFLIAQTRTLSINAAATSNDKEYFNLIVELLQNSLTGSKGL